MYDMSKIALAGSGEKRGIDGRKEIDSTLHVAFVTQAIRDEEASKAAGREIFNDVPHIFIRVPGDDTFDKFTYATDEDKERFPHEWDAYQKGVELTVHGTAIESLPGITPRTVAELKSMNVRTVEQLASLSDSVQLMGLQGFKTQARTFLGQAASDEAEALKKRIADLEKKLAKKGDATE